MKFWNKGFVTIKKFSWNASFSIHVYFLWSNQTIIPVFSCFTILCFTFSLQLKSCIFSIHLFSQSSLRVPEPSWDKREFDIWPREERVIVVQPCSLGCGSRAWPPCVDAMVVPLRTVLRRSDLPASRMCTESRDLLPCVQEIAAGDLDRGFGTIGIPGLC